MKCPSVEVFRDNVAALRQDFALQRPVEARRKAPKNGVRGRYCLRRRKKIGPRGGVTYPLVHVLTIGDDEEWFETLLHEWAHALRSESNPSADHDDAYWKIYGRLYRRYME